jgi:hypothetical protein
MLKRAAKSALRSIGYEIRALKHTCDLDLFFGLLDRLRFKASHIVDVGANQGNWTRTAVRYFPQALYTLVEPQQHLRASVQDLALLWQIYSRRCSLQIHFRQCGHRCGRSRAKSSRMAWRTAGRVG